MTEEARGGTDIVRQAFERFNEGDLDGMQALMAPDAEVVPLRAAIEDISYRGPDAIRRFWADAMDSWSDLRVEIERLEAAGDRVLAVGRLQGTARDTGAAVDTRVAWVVTLRRDRVIRFRTFPSEESATAHFADTR